MTVRLTLLCTAAPVERDVRFGDARLDERALRQVQAAARSLPAATASLLYSAPSQRCAQTFEVLGWDVVTVEPALRDVDTGNWLGRTLAEVAAEDGAGLGTWMSDPDAAPHGGESVAQVCHRIATWMDGLPDDAGRVLAVVEPAVVRAAVVSALGAPQQSFWRIDVPPLTVVQLTGRGGRWNLRMGAVSFVGGDGSG
ncbi:histidine phosphatase family protein [Streptomyces sp. NPDC056470]|uniref:histidine phosphatase family protein n=1 Tax=Streptomyces sp. NPDC056470 TaxID=3345831 RepID=UPI00368663AD